MRVMALLATYNEERFVAGCLENLIRQGVDVYLIDNSSTDRTVAIASRYLGRGLTGLERLPHDGVFRWRRILQRKEELAATLDADWFLHVDADERHLPPRNRATLAAALRDADERGFTTASFREFIFVPTMESPDHDHPGFERTMQYYYPFEPQPSHLVRAWKRQSARVDLSSTGGHRPNFPGMRLYPEPFVMRHYLALSPLHLVEKYANRRFDQTEVRNGWHGWRTRVTGEIAMPSRRQMRAYTTDTALDPSHPRARHWFEDFLDAGSSAPARTSGIGSLMRAGGGRRLMASFRIGPWRSPSAH